jgi:hypothetical protein
MIPLLSVTTVNQIDSFERLIASIDYPIKTLSVLCNSYSFDYLLEIKKRCVSDFVGEFMLSCCPYNMGCASSWNYHMKMNPECDYWIFSGDDITFSEGDLENANEASKACDIAFSSLPAKYSFFSLSKKCVNLVGFFDENIHPANFEDDDYDRRIKRYELLIGTFDFDGYHIGSGTTHNLSEDDRAKLKHFYELNQRYYRAKIANDNYTSGTFDFEERSKKLIRIQ